MIAKKNRKANLERKRFAFFQIGLLISGSLCLAAFEYTTVKPDHYTHIISEDNQGIIWEEPKAEEDFKIIEDQPKTAKVVYIKDLDEVKIVDRFEKKGDPVITDNPDFISMEGDFSPDWTKVDMNLAEDGEKDWEVVEKEPQFPGGTPAMFEFIGNNVNYPQLPKEMGIQGKVFVHFVVSKTGAINKVSSSLAPHEDLAKEAMRVVQMMPTWIPGEQAGKKVNVKYTLPVQFILH